MGRDEGIVAQIRDVGAEIALKTSKVRFWEKLWRTEASLGKWKSDSEQR